MNNFIQYFKGSLKSAITILTCIFLLLDLSVLNAETDDPKDWSIVATYTIPGKASGLAWDGAFLYFGIYF
ncbi:MAG: hypothetical protein FJY07_11765, partial [Bacteroidetes bacterium]|nr:hypothetical protein [Bacteroidota bacterium]